MMTIDTMIYIILAISGIATVSLYLNIFCAIKLHNYIEYNHKVKDCNDAVEELHIENMNLIEQIDKLKTKEYKSNLHVRPSIQTQGYYEDRKIIEDNIENMVRHYAKDKDKDNVMEIQYKSNIKAQTNNE